MRRPRNAPGSRLKALGKQGRAVASSLEPPASSRAADLLLEIGTEELPAAYLPELTAQLRREAETLLRSSHLRFGGVQTFGAPRRLVLVVRNLERVQRKPGEEIRGPSKQVSFDGNGKPTPALSGFLRSQGGTLAQTKVVTTPKGEYVYFLKPPTIAPVARLLPELLTQLIGGLRAPKAMRWDASGVRFARPIRWLVALHGARSVRCRIGSLRSGTTTWIGQPLRPRALTVSSVNNYLVALTRAGVILHQEARRGWIERAVTQAALRLHGRPAPETAEHGLLDEVTNLVERPAPLTGSFDRKYLALPREVLLASMAKYQRVFAIEARGALLPAFVAILEGKPGKPAAVRRVFERILNARLADSLLFWEEDRRHPLTEAILSGVTFHEQLGSMEGKTQRVSQLGHTLAEVWRMTAQEAQWLERACGLAKCDLVTRMVKEFPTLQGVMGKHYVFHAGEPRAVAEAIEEHYLPLGGKAPKTLIGRALAILDKYDTLAGYFSVGIEPTGDQDPFGLRRAAQGIVEVAWVAHRSLPLSALFTTWSGHASLARMNVKPTPQIAARVHRYILERLATFAWPKPTPGADVINAVLASPCDDLVDAMDRIVCLQQLAGHPSLLKAAKVVERTRNILKGASARQQHVDPNRLTEPLEHQLWNVYTTHRPTVDKLIQKKSYAEATTHFGDVFYQPLHEFFDRVLVNTPEAAIQQNRLALMHMINALYTDRIADLSQLAIVHTEALPQR